MQLTDKPKVLYIGQYSEGTTSKQRADTIKSLLDTDVFRIIDLHEPFYRTSRVWRSIGFRYKKGPLIPAVNTFIRNKVQEPYDLIWVDKGIYITAATTAFLRAHTKKLVHFTPDPAFTFHKSRLFYQSLKFYDYVITTKSYELERYFDYLEEEQVLFVTQGFDPNLHQPDFSNFDEKEGLLFIGHYEVERARVISALLDAGTKVKLAGIKWDKFVQKNNNPNLNYLGRGVYGADYVKAIQQAQMAWGAVSKWVPELHTTRTFEIPACGTALVTERNKETSSFFNEEDVIFYDSETELVKRVGFFMNNKKALLDVTQKGYERVCKGGYDYRTILERIIEQILR